MNRRSRFLATVTGLLILVACTYCNNNDDGYSETSDVSGRNGGATDGIVGNTVAGSGGSELADTNGVGESVETGSESVEDESESIETGTESVEAETGGDDAGTGSIEAGTGRVEDETENIEAETGGDDAGTGSTKVGTENVEDETESVEDGTGGDAYMPPCLTKPSQVVINGDSYIIMYADTLLQPRIEELARADGALGAGEFYRNYAFPGTSMGNGQIPSHFDTAVAVDPDIKLVIMTGGGNDVLIGAMQCEAAGSSTNPECQSVVQNAMDKAESLFEKSVSVGVSDVIYFFYPHIPSCLLTGEAPNEILDYAYPMARELCEGAEETYDGAIRCHFIDLRPIFGDDYQHINPLDCIHPTASGADLIANEIYQIMKDNCLAQPESSGCCAP